MPRSDYLSRCRDRSIDVTARQDSINWILKVWHLSYYQRVMCASMIFHVWNFILLGARLLSLQTRNGVSVCELLGPFPLLAFCIGKTDRLNFFLQ